MLFQNNLFCKFPLSFGLILWAEEKGKQFDNDHSTTLIVIIGKHSLFQKIFQIQNFCSISRSHKTLIVKHCLSFSFFLQAGSITNSCRENNQSP